MLRQPAPQAAATTLPPNSGEPFLLRTSLTCSVSFKMSQHAFWAALMDIGPNALSTIPRDKKPYLLFEMKF